ncbi:MAG: hypothetical protein HFF09_06635 [Oscillospiraceae bacterium]|nr:hypothetical protein [Oscillospiraceae bacterium]
MLGRKGTPRPEQFRENRIYDYSTREAREATAAWLFAEAKSARTAKEAEWRRYNDYYNFIHDVSDEVRAAVQEQGLPWTPAVVPDPFIMVESQIDPIVPEPEFRGRDDEYDPQKAKMRESAVRYIMQENRIEDMNTANERRLKKLGDAFWKAYWDADMSCGRYEGNIRVRDVPVEALYPDPTAGAEGLQAGQFVAYLYRLHKIKFWQMFHRELKEQGLELNDLLGAYYQDREGIFDMVSATDEADDTIQVMEFWFKQPFDTMEVPAGAVACTIQAGGHEVRYIPQYWQRTGRQNQLFPFVHYWCIRDENEFYNKSELLPIMSLVDGADRELANALVNDAFTANDIILMEEGALADGEEFSNVPGAQVLVKPNRIGAVARLGGLHDGRNSLVTINWLLEQIQRANRNYETNLGKESARVTTASGLAQLRSDADGQAKIKRADRNAGFARLYELLDWLALEFFEDERLLYLGAKDERETGETVAYRADDYALEVGEVHDAETGEKVRDAYIYYPRVDVTVTAGDGVIRSKAATLEALDKLSAIPVTADNYKLLAAELEILDIPQKKAIIEEWEKKFQPAVPQAVLQALAGDPMLLAAVEQAVAGKAQTQAAPEPDGLGAVQMQGGVML